MLRLFGIDTIHSAMIHFGTTVRFLSVATFGCLRTDLPLADFLSKGFQSHAYPVLQYTKYKKEQLKEGERRNSRARITTKYKRQKRQERIGTQRYSKEMTDVSDVLYAFV